MCTSWELFTVQIDQNLIALNVRNDEIYDNCIFELYKVFVTRFNSITLLTFKFFFVFEISYYDWRLKLSELVEKLVTGVFSKLEMIWLDLIWYFNLFVRTLNIWT